MALLLIVSELAACSKPSSTGPVVFIGDSITKNWNVPGVNAGVAGEGTLEIRKRLRAVLETHPRFLHILAGTNDDLRTEPDKAVHRIKRMAMAARSSGTYVVIGTIPPYSQKFWQAQHAKSFNKELLEMAAEYEIPVADYYSAMSKDGVQIPSLFMDGIHPNDAGYAVMRSVLDDVIKNDRGLDVVVRAAPAS